jgi:hypothetical protein
LVNVLAQTEKNVTLDQGLARPGFMFRNRYPDCLNPSLNIETENESFSLSDETKTETRNIGIKVETETKTEYK